MIASRIDQPTASRLLRGCLLLLCLGLAVAQGDHLPWSVGVLIVAGALGLAPVRSGQRAAVFVELALVAGGVVLTGSSHSPLLPYLLAPFLAIGLRGSSADVVLGGGVTTAALLVTYAGKQDESLPAFVLAVTQWVVLGVASGLVASWARQLTTATDSNGLEDRYADTRALLEELRLVTRELPQGLDARAAAESLLERCAHALPGERLAVLVRLAGEELVPLAVRGMHRVPWRAPLDQSGPLNAAMSSGTPVVDVRLPDDAGRRQGSAVCVLPLVNVQRAYGAVVIESVSVDAYPIDLVMAVWRELREPALRLETALLFHEVQLGATSEERDRVAREVHDGIAQELSALGYQLDDLRLRAARGEVDLDERVLALRTGVTGLISDLRQSITDLRSTPDGHRGLGTQLSNHVRSVVSGKSTQLHLTLAESSFRLPVEQEIALFGIAQSVSQDLRRCPDAEHFWVSLFVDPPSVRMELAHDGRPDRALRGEITRRGEELVEGGGTLSVTAPEQGGIRVVVELRGNG